MSDASLGAFGSRRARGVRRRHAPEMLSEKRSAACRRSSLAGTRWSSRLANGLGSSGSASAQASAPRALGGPRREGARRRPRLHYELGELVTVGSDELPPGRRPRAAAGRPALARRDAVVVARRATDVHRLQCKTLRKVAILHERSHRIRGRIAQVAILHGKRRHAFVSSLRF